ncbi:hypothetical protein BGZ83_004778 [Gryganskiella cystojenkinii]|nr:hypothetical protein BGZ83_004778 [Gryganskiella cystojenkinii]
MNRLFKDVHRHNAPPANMNKPLPEPLVDPDEGKTPIGELVIVPIQGKDLPNRERFGKQDPFILFKLGNVAKRSTTDIRGGQKPRWNDDQINIFMYDSEVKDAKSLYVTCLDEDPQKNDLIGDCVINLSKVLEEGEQDDWFELLYKGKEAGQLLLQLTYYSHDPKHPTHKSNRPAASEKTLNGAIRRSIHPVKETKVEEKTPEEDSNTDEGPVYKPPVVPEAPVYQDPTIAAAAMAMAAGQVPMVPGAVGYPYGTLPPGAPRPVSPNHYVGHHTPQFPPVNPYGQPQVPANPYATVPGTVAYPGYPAATAAAGMYPDPNLGDPNKRHSFTGQPPVIPPGAVYPPTGYPIAPTPAIPMAYPPQATSPAFPQSGFPGGYPSGPNSNASSPYAPNQPLPILAGAVGNGPAPGPGQGGYPPAAGFPYAAPNAYPNNNNGYPPQSSGSMGSNNSFNGSFHGNSNNNQGGNPYGTNSHSAGHVNQINNNNSSNNGFNNGGFGNNNNGFNNNNGNNNNNNNSNNNGFNNNNNNGGFNNNNGGFNSNSNNNGGFNNNNTGGFNNNNNNTNNFNSGGGNFSNNNQNNGGGFNSNNNGGFNNSNQNNGGFNNNDTNNFNNNNNNNNFNNNGNNGYQATPMKKNTIVPTPIIPKATPPVAQRLAGESMYGPGGL